MSNGFLTLSSFRWVHFSAIYFRNNPCFTAWQQIKVWNRHTTSGHRKMSIFSSSIVYGYDRASLRGIQRLSNRTNTACTTFLPVIISIMSIMYCIDETVATRPDAKVDGKRTFMFPIVQKSSSARVDNWDLREPKNCATKSGFPPKLYLSILEKEHVTNQTLLTECSWLQHRCLHAFNTTQNMNCTYE